MKILLIDDDPEILDNFTLIISYKRPEIQLITASNGKEALSLIEQDGIDLIISDIKMPFLDGFQLKKELNKRGVKTPVVFLSGLMLVDSALIGRQLGAVGFLNKPLSGDELVGAIDRARDYNARIKPKQEYLAPVAELIVQCEGAKAVTQKLSGDYSIGRSPDADIRLSSPVASREHALLNRTEQSLMELESVKNHYRLIDYSRNGFLVNGTKIKGYALLNHGDIIVFPGCQFLYFVISQKGKLNPFSTLPNE